MTLPFRRVAIVGVGLLGGSLGLALRKRDRTVHVRGVGRSVERLELARRIGAIHEFELERRDALADRDLVVLATPIEHILATLGALGRLAPGAVVTDVGSTKRAISARAREALPSGVAFVGGHPLAGKEAAGVEHGDPDLFVGAPYVLCSEAGDALGRMSTLVEGLGARPVILTPEEHDRAAAWISHLPQLLSTGLAEVVRNQTGEPAKLAALAGSGFRDMVRLAGSPYAVWKGIFETNADNIDHALASFVSEIESLRRELRRPEIERTFERANGFYRTYRAKA
jgi:prephenate dehydrogenase